MAEKPFNVLLVENDARDADRLARTFSAVRVADLQTVDSVEQAVSYLSGRERYADRSAYPMPNLILINLAVSRRSDFKLLRWLRGQPELRRIPVVVLASARQPIGFDKAFDLGAASYLVKPIEPEALRSMTQAVIEFWRLDDRHRDRQGKG